MRYAIWIFLFMWLSFTASTHATEETLNDKAFMTLSEGQQHWFLVGSFYTLSHSVAMDSPEKSQCIKDWFFGDVDGKSKLLLSNIAKHPTHSPTAIILAYMRRVCDVFPKAKP